MVRRRTPPKGPLAGKLMQSVGSKEEKQRSLSLVLPAFPRSRQPFSGSEAPIAEPSRAAQYPRGLRNTEPLIAQSRRGGRQA